MSSAGPPLSTLGTRSGEQGEQCQSRCLLRINSTQSHPPSTPRPWACSSGQVSQTKVWLCLVPQTLPKIAPGNARVDEGVFPESFAF